MPFSDYQRALVTGASSGLGSAIAERLAREGLEVHALARSAAALDELAERTGCIAHVIDVTDLAAVTALTREFAFDILVNNAGVSRSGNILNADASDIDDQVDVNLRAALHLIRLTLPGMMERDRGHIVNVTSIAGLYQFGGHTAYHATKAAMHTVSRQIRVDAFGRQVRVTEICPGRIETDIFAKVEKITREEAKERFYGDYETPQPSDIADAVAYAIGAPHYVNIGHLEIMPTMQVPGGLRTARVSTRTA